MDIFAEALRRGIETSFVDAMGRTRTPSPEVIRFFLDRSAAMHLSWLDGPQVCRRQGDCSVHLRQAAFDWTLERHDHVLASGSVNAERIDIPKPEEGIYKLSLRDRHGHQESVPLVCAPERSFVGNFDKVWLLAVQLYSVRSSRNWGIGDFTDLAEILAWVASRGGAGVGLNPLHVLFDDAPDDCSPYAPNSRLFLNPLYVDVERLPEFSGNFASAYADTITALNSADLVDYSGVLRLKRKAMRCAFERFQSNHDISRKMEFEDFKVRSGPLLFRFACFEVLRKRFKRPWWEWPRRWACSDDLALNELNKGASKAEIEFVQFAQWCADQQLKDCKELAEKLGMKVGLYLDVAVGVRPDGFDAWNEQEAIDRELSVGAPPDILNTQGQNWGLAGYSASGLQSVFFRPFEEMLHASMRYAGAIRLDHVLGLNRMYLVPRAMSPDQGTYLKMPFEALLATIAIQSHRHSCVVIGEDLGTVPDGFREALADWGVWSYRVMMFERGNDGAFVQAHRYPSNSLATFGTHDLPTYHGWLVGGDLRLKCAMGVDPGESNEARAASVASLAHALAFQQSEGSPDVFSMLKFLAETPSRILAVSIEDLLSIVEQVNVPGTTTQYPNWRRRLPLEIHQWPRTIDEEKLDRVMAGRSS